MTSGLVIRKVPLCRRSTPSPSMSACCRAYVSSVWPSPRAPKSKTSLMRLSWVSVEYRVPVSDVRFWSDRLRLPTPISSHHRLTTCVAESSPRTRRPIFSSSASFPGCRSVALGEVAATGGCNDALAGIREKVVSNDKDFNALGPVSQCFICWLQALSNRVGENVTLEETVCGMHVLATGPGDCNTQATSQAVE